MTPRKILSIVGELCVFTASSICFCSFLVEKSASKIRGRTFGGMRAVLEAAAARRVFRRLLPRCRFLRTYEIEPTGKDRPVLSSRFA